MQLTGSEMIEDGRQREQFDLLVHFISHCSLLPMLVVWAFFLISIFLLQSSYIYLQC